MGYLTYWFRPGCGSKLNQDRTLSAVQIQRLLMVADGVRRSLMAAAAGVNATTAPSVVALAEQKRVDIVTTAMNSLPSSIDADAAAKIGVHIAEHIKRQIKLLTATMPAPAAAN